MLNPEARRLDKSLLARDFTYRARPRALLVAAAAIATPSAVFATATSPCETTLTVGPGETYLVPETIGLTTLVIGAGGTLAAPTGYSLTLTVNGVEVGSTLESLYVNAGAYAYIAAGTYQGKVVITVAEANIITYNTRQWPIRQALYVGAAGVNAAKSALTAIVGGTIGASSAKRISIASRGEAFNGVYVDSGSYTLIAPKIDFVGNGRNDFIGYGSAILGTGASTTLVVDAATIRTRGVVRDGIIADGGAVVIVKNSTINVKDGQLPAEYENTGDTSFMMTCPWLLGMYGTVRATNLLGVNTRATYLNTSVTNENWALFSVDAGRNGGNGCKLVVVNCELRHTGTSGYGSYAIGSPTEHFLGNEFNVATYVAIVWGGAGLYYGDSSPAAVQALNDSLALGLSAQDIASVKPRTSTIRSRKFGFMWHSTGPVYIGGGTELVTDQTMFLSKASASSVFVDGSGGAQLHAKNGVIYQLMDNDNPGRVNVTGYPWTANYTKSYVQPTADAVRSLTFDPTVEQASDARGSFSGITLKGDFYNGVLGGGVGNMQGKNLVLTFTDSVIRGIISATKAVHLESPINFDNHDQLGVVTNTPQPVVNNGVIVTLGGTSTWQVTGTSYLSKLIIGADANVVAAGAGEPALTVNGTPTAITPGTTYTGAITLTV
ncbi:hypothetical protein [Phytohabitans rumicis]|uniref:Uncharacterized protein n=1 Tax=Phytohabitans rumicis TaxID=1076125 RepID=A0A6V8LI68_9ACTN|nr:hypothetical protein [Phytohabitans rumicis]GFJ93797.1 hypothetical protein Prum_074390 [Phytohabitans rumicis]